MEVAESQLAESLNLPRETLREIRERNLVEGKDWKQRGGVGIVWLAAGQRKVAALLRRSAEATEAPAAAEAVERAIVAPGEPTWLRVVKVTRNRQLLVARAQGEPNGEDQLIRVRDNRLFLPGMLVPVRPLDTPGRWAYAGPLPLRKGRLPGRLQDEARARENEEWKMKNEE